MTLDFNEGWLFSKEGDVPARVHLPHDAMRTEARRAGCPGGVNSGYYPGGKYIYEKVFTLPAEARGKYISLHFEGVYQNCTVILNDITVCTHRYGYTPFDADLSAAIQLGENRLRVIADNSLMPNCRWYSGAGIFRGVTLEIREPVHITFVHVCTLSADPAVIRVDTDGDRVQVFDGETCIFDGAPGEISLPGARLWSAESPALCRMVVHLGSDTRELSFGIRQLQWSPESGLTLNGQRVLLRGGCIHHDHGILGAAEFRAAEERRLRILKEQGFNALRMAHNPASKITLELCDELGLYVMNEAFDGWYTPKTYHDYARWFDEDWKKDLTAMVESSRNHPCVILYSVGNEVSETATGRGGEVCRELTALVRGLDPTRPVTAGINVLLNVYAKMGMGVYKDKGPYKAEPLPEGKAYREKKTGSAFFNAVTSKLGKLMFFMSRGRSGDEACRGADALDVLGLNYASSQYDYQAKHHPERLMVGAESMVSDLPYNWARVLKYPQLLGDFVWAAWDYLGEACIGDWTYHSYPGLPLLAGQGMIDITGKPLAAMAYMQVVWGLRKEPFIGVRPLNHAHEIPSTGAWQFTNAIDSWSWQGFEGIEVPVEVFSPGASVRLSLNGKVIGRKRLKDCKAKFRLPYSPGILTAEALDEQGRVLSAHSLTSAGEETVLTVKPEKAALRADGQDLCYIPIEFTDSRGSLKPCIEQPVRVSVRGAASLAGFGSALCKTDEVFTAPEHMSYRGRCLAVLRAGTEPGKATVTVTSANTEPIITEIEVV